MKKEFEYLRVGVKRISLGGLVEAIFESPVGDFLPRVGRAEFGGKVRVKIEGEEKVLPVSSQGKGVVVGDRVYTHWVGDSPNSVMDSQE